MLSTLAEAKRINDILENYELPSGEDDCRSKIDELSEIRKRLIQQGFNRLFAPQAISVRKEMPFSEARDIRRQLRELRYAAYLKKSTLRRVDYAMAAYRIAELHFRSGALENAYRHLPYDGSLVRRISRFGATAARLYFDIYELLSGELEQLGISVDVAVPSENGVRCEKLQLYGIKDVDDYVIDTYGKDTEVIKTKIITRHKSILTSNAYRKVLACAYAASTASTVSVPLREEDKKHEMLQKYIRILEKHGISELIKVDVFPDIQEAIIDDLLHEQLAYPDLKGDVCLHDDLNLKLNEIMNRRYWEYAKEAYGKLATDIIRLLMLTSRAARKDIGVFSFDDDISLVKPVLEKAGLSGIIRAGEMVESKMRIESALGSSSRKLGLAVFAHYQGKKRLKEIFSVEFKDIEEEYKLIKAYLEGKGRGEKFLEHLKR